MLQSMQPGLARNVIQLMARSVFVLKCYDTVFGVFETEELALIHAKLIDYGDDAYAVEVPFNNVYDIWRKDG